jgi:hypothetical protein
MTNKQPTKWKLKLFITIWLIASTYFAVFEIDDRLAVHYQKQVISVTLSDIAESLPDVAPLPQEKPE